MSCSSTSRGRRSASPRATASRSRSGCATRRPEALGQFMYNAPQRAKRLYFDVIPQAVDEYLANAAKARAPAGRTTRRTNPAWHIHGGACRRTRDPGLVRHAAQPRQRGERRDAGHPVGLHPPLQPRRAARTAMPFLDRLVGSRDRLLPGLRAPGEAVPPRRTDQERAALARPRRDAARPASRSADAEAIQTVALRGRQAPRFRANCAPGSAASIRCCSASRKGPRFGGFVALYGIAETIALIEAALTRRPGRRGLTPEPAGCARPRLKNYLRHLPALLGVALLVRRDLRGAERVPQPQARRHRRRRSTRSRPARCCSSFGWTLLSYFVLTFYDRLGTIYAGHKVSYGGSRSPRSAPTRCRIISASPPFRARRCATGSTRIGASRRSRSPRRSRSAA